MSDVLWFVMKRSVVNCGATYIVRSEPTCDAPTDAEVRDIEIYRIPKKA